MQTIGRLDVRYDCAMLVNHRREVMCYLEDFLRPMGGCVVTVRECFDEDGQLDAVLFLREGANED